MKKGPPTPMDTLKIEHKTMGIVHNLSTGEIKEAVIDDISVTGFRILLEKDRRKFAKIGQEVEIRFDFLTLDEGENDEEEIKVKGIVRNLFKEGPEWIAFGVEAHDEERRMEKLEETWLALVFENYD